MNRPTPGHFAIRDYCDTRAGVRRSRCIVAPGAGNFVVVRAVYGRTIEECDANTAMFAAAPAMLDALRMCVRALSNPAADAVEAAATAQAAIDLAQGEAR